MSQLSQPSRTNVLGNVREYARRVAATRHETSSETDAIAAEARLAQTLAELRERINNERAALEQLQKDDAVAQQQHSGRESSPRSLSSVRGPSTDPILRFRQLKALTNAYVHLAEREPEVPGPHSVLPVLLALHATAQRNATVRSSMKELHSELSDARHRLATEQRNLRENQELRDTLRARVEALRNTVVRMRERPAQKTAEDTARKRIAAAETQQIACDAEARQCTRSLVRFINTRLAPLLAAEELGGPVAGSEPDLTEDAVLAGFTTNGRVKKKPPSKTEATSSNDTTFQKQQRLRQQRIDAIWGPSAAETDSFTEEDATRSETEAAAVEMQTLTQSLLDARSTDGTSTRYVRLSRDSAAARFLVRANVALLHRTDARRICLHDFGHEAAD